jgi:hypothetical protein
MQPENIVTKRGHDSRAAGSHAEVRTSRALHMTVVLTALPTPLPTPRRGVCRQGVRAGTKRVTRARRNELFDAR